MATQETLEFLLQQEGDQSWLPLESPNVEILEGRYRIIARSDHKNADLEVRIAHEAVWETPPKRRIQKRSARSNRDGFVLIMPFTLLQPGSWAISCMGDVMAELLGQHWQQTIQLHVLPKETEVTGDWEPDWQQPPPIPATPELPPPPLITATPLLDVVAAAPPPPKTAAAAPMTDLFSETPSTHREHGDDRTELLPPALEPVDAAVDLPALLQPLDQPSAPNAVPSSQSQAEPVTELSLEQYLSSDMPHESDLSEADRSAADLSETHFSETHFSDANLSETHFSEANLSTDGLSDSDLLELDELLGLDQASNTTASTPTAATDQIDLMDQFDAWLEATPPRTPAAASTPAETHEDLDQFDAWLEAAPPRTPAAASAPAETSEDLDQFDIWLEELNQPPEATPTAPEAVSADLSLEELLTQEELGFLGSADAAWDQTLAAAITPQPDRTTDLDSALLGHELDERSRQPSAGVPFEAEEAGPPREPELASALPPLHLRLEREIYTFTRQSPMHQANLTIAGRIQTDGTRAILPQGELVITLRDPETGAMVVEQRQPLLQQPLPMDLAASLALPQDCRTQLLLGEVVLWDDGVEALAQQSFTATAAIEDLLAVTQPGHDTAAAFEATSSTESATASASPELPNLQGIGSAPVLLHPVPSQPRESNGVDLPRFNRIAHPADSPSEPSASSARSQPQESNGVDLPRFNLPSHPADLPPEPSEDLGLGELDLDFLFDPSNLSELTLRDWAMPTTPAVEPPPDQAALTLPDEPVVVDWWNLAETESASPLEAETDREPPQPTPSKSAAVLSEPLSAGDREPDADRQPAPSAPARAAAWEFLPAFELESEPKEVVVDEVPVIPASLKPAPVVEPNPLLLPADEPVPVPILTVESPELVVGRTVTVKVQLPNIRPRLYVKLWINDRQSRTLLEGPHWLVDFTPNGLGQQEAKTRLMVPFGSLDVQIGAIAIEAATKRESYRTTVNRSVVAPESVEAYAELEGV